MMTIVMINHHLDDDEDVGDDYSVKSSIIFLFLGIPGRATEHENLDTSGKIPKADY